VNEAEHSVRLKSGLPSTATWVRLALDGTLTVEWYDYSEQAQRTFGNDVAFLLTIQPSETLKLWSLLLDAQERPATYLPEALVFLQQLQDRFDDYFAIKQWLDENSISYYKTFDSWA
jgi:hypothetical protein